MQPCLFIMAAIDENRVVLSVEFIPGNLNPIN